MDRHAIITGGAGFIGSHMVDLLLAEGGWQVTVIDNFDPCYPRASKEANIAQHRNNGAFELVEGDILDDADLIRAFARSKGNSPVVMHFAAKVGVRPSLSDPLGYHRVNTTGTLKLLEQARRASASHFIFASSSSVYGETPDAPWTEESHGLRPISPYAVSKIAAEEFVRVHARLHGMPATILRFFTAHGPRQRPDLAIHSFFHAIRNELPVRQFGDGSSSRDYTYVGDIARGVRGAIDRKLGEPQGQQCETFNLGNSHTTTLLELIAAIEKETGRSAIIDRQPAQPGDVSLTCADITKARAHLGYAPDTSLSEGLRLFNAWFSDRDRVVLA
ncbi:MAG: GDP-mannose 4,6-dehydratase [Flavobacteriales bacterium]